VDGHSFGIVHRLGRLLADASFVEINYAPFVLDASSGSALHLGASNNTEVVFVLLKPYLVCTGVIEDEEFEQLYRQVSIDLRAPDFTCLSFGCSVLGMRPEK